MNNEFNIVEYYVTHKDQLDKGIIDSKDIPNIVEFIKESIESELLECSADLLNIYEIFVNLDAGIEEITEELISKLSLLKLYISGKLENKFLKELIDEEFQKNVYKTMLKISWLSEEHKEKIPSSLPDFLYIENIVDDDKFYTLLRKYYKEIF